MRTRLRFDLPVETANQRRDYRQFVKFIKKQGFIRFQESIYVKLSINESAVKNRKRVIQSHLPREGKISWMTITEKQFADIDYRLGDFETDIINTDDRYIEL